MRAIERRREGVGNTENAGGRKRVREGEERREIAMSKIDGLRKRENKREALREWKMQTERSKERR